ncbi:MAG TPA: glycosyl hydrolase [Thermoanaerobaculia bacterium]|nr:glycosyl hydrolase [Thermoanaerobaculia bacterium]
MSPDLRRLGAAAALAAAAAMAAQHPVFGAVSVVGTAGTAAPTAPPAAAAPLAELFGALRLRSVGPYRGGRACAVSGVRGQPLTYYMGNSGGGVWKTTDGGITWLPISDHDFATGSVGAIAVAPSDPNVLYVGTGESQLRGNVAAGDGVYKSTDAGRSWVNVGLKETQHVARVVVHPSNPDLVYAAAFGHAWGANPERGIYRSRDGGKSWQRVLFVDDRTGASDLAIDPNNPRILYAAFWQAYRSPWSIESGGPGGGLYRSTDGGDSWKRLAGGLPEGIVGRIGVAVSAPRAGRVWAIVEAREGGLFRSDDGGDSWVRVNREHKLRQRAWYYSWVYADPKNGDTVYVPNVELWKSIDGGQAFSMIGPRFWDNHDLWLDPDDPRRMILGNDGGARVSGNGGESWSGEDNQPTAQIYRVATDDRFPYWLYGAQQDSTSIAIPSAAPGPGITARDWHPVGGGESGWVVPDPRDPDVVFGGGYGGSITRYDHRTRQAREVTAWPQQIDGQATRDLKYRWNWNAPILVSRHEPGVVYHGAQLLLRSRDGGESWEEASLDLTRNDRSKQGFSGGPIGLEITGVEVYDTIFAIAESPHEPGTIWVGTDDGLVQLTRDGGKNWRNVTPKDLPPWIQVNSLEVSPHDRATAYFAATNFKLDDRRPFLYETNDYGKSWRRIDRGIPAGAFTRVVREDPARRGLLFAGTETGLYLSLDDGASWQRFQLNLPAVPITDLQIKGGDLVVATQGRAFWILDDLTPLRRWEPAIASSAVHLFPPRPAFRTAAEGLAADEALRSRLGQNPPPGAVIDFWLGAEPAKDEVLTVEVLDGDRLLRRYSSQPSQKQDKETATGPAPAKEDEDEHDPPLAPQRGLNRVVWDLRMTVPTLVVPRYVYDDWPPAGVKVRPGTYRVRLRFGKQLEETAAEVRPDPGSGVSAADLGRQAELLSAIHARLGETHDLVRRLRDLRGQLHELAERAALIGKDGPLAPRVRELERRLDELLEKLLNRELQADEDSLVYTPALDFQFASLAGVTATADARPTLAEVRRFAELDGQLATVRARLQQLLERELAELNRAAAAAGIGPVLVRPPASAITNPPL